MIITQAPFRISFFGGGTDYQLFFEKYGGSVLSTTFNKYCYSFLRKLPPFFEYKTQIKYAKIESVGKTEEIEHPLIKNCMQFTNSHNLSITYDADLPARSGLGSSSSFAVALLQGIYAMQGKYVSKRELAEKAIYVERVLCAESGGWQDQIASAFGGFNRIDFNESGFSVNPIIISKKRKQELEQKLLLFFTGISRISAKVAASQAESIKDKKQELLDIKNYVYDAEKILISDGDLTDFGKLMDYAWKLKRSLTNNISTNLIDNIYSIAKNNGAIGGKLLGAGGGGFMLFFAEPYNHERIKKALANLIHIPFQFENDGVKIIHFSQDEYDLGDIK
jgi:D-glycero-alpha-D-manno-heptose-7-phosphate kinase